MSKLNRWPLVAVLLGAGAALAAIIFSHGAYFGWTELLTHGTTLAALGATLALAAVGLAFCLLPRLRAWFASFGGADFLVVAGGLLAAYLLAFFLGDGLMRDGTLELLQRLFIPSGLYLAFLLALGTWALVKAHNPFSGLKVERGMALLFCGLLFANILSWLLIAASQPKHDLAVLASRFLMEREQSVYTYVSAAVLLLVGWLNWKAGWRWLGAFFILLSVDEVAGFHEVIVDAMRRVGEQITGSMLAYLILLVPLLGVVGWLCLRALRGASSRQRWLFLSGLGMLILGAVLVEAISWAVFAAFSGYSHTPVILVYALQIMEEGQELAGALLLLLFSIRESQKAP